MRKAAGNVSLLHETTTQDSVLWGEEAYLPSSSCTGYSFYHVDLEWGIKGAGHG